MLVFDDIMNLENYHAQGFDRGRALWVEWLWRLVSGCVFQSPFVPFYGLKRAVLRAFGARIGAGVLIKPRVTITFPWKLEVGAHSWIGEGVWIDNLAEVRLGANSVLSQGAYLCTGNHDYTDEAFSLRAKGIVLGARAWVGAKAILAPGVSVGEGCVIALGSVVMKDCEGGHVYAGHPAVKVKKR